MKYLKLIVLLPLLFANCKNKLENNVLKEKTMKKVLFVVTSHDKLGNTGEKTGFWLESKKNTRIPSHRESGPCQNAYD